MRKSMNYFLSLFALASIIFLASCGDDGEVPIGNSIVLSTDNDRISNDSITIAPGESIDVTATLPVGSTGDITVAQNPALVTLPSNDTIASGDAITVTVPADAKIGATTVLTFSGVTASVNKQITVTIGYAYASVYDLIADQDQFSLLKAAIDEANLPTTLQGAGPFTVFAPTNAAFGAFGIKELADLPSDKQELTNLLLYHVLNGKVLSTDLAAGPVETVEGSNVTVAIATDGTITINDAKVTAVDMLTGNGVVHTIDKVLESEIGTATAVLLGGQLSTAYGSYYNVMSDTVYMRAGAEANPAMVDLLYWYSGEAGANIVGAPDNQFARQAFDNTDFTSMNNDTRFRTTTVTAATFDGIQTQSQLEGAAAGDFAATDSRVTNLQVDQVFAFQLGESRGGNVGLVKVKAIPQASQGTERQVEIEVKYVK